jgi:hypothetical protein
MRPRRKLPGMVERAEQEAAEHKEQVENEIKMAPAIHFPL